jgi:hypothetical protein
MAKSMRVNRNKRYSKRRTNNRATSRKSARRPSKRKSRRNKNNLRGGMRGGEKTAAVAGNSAAAAPPIYERATAGLAGPAAAKQGAANAGPPAAPPPGPPAPGPSALGDRPAPPLKETEPPARASGEAGSASNPMYGALKPDEIGEIIGEIFGDEFGDMVLQKLPNQRPEILRTGTLVLLGVLIQQLELPEERDEGRIKSAATELLKHIEFIGKQLEAEADVEGYGKALFRELSGVLQEIVNQDSAASAPLAENIEQTLFNLRQAFAILDAKDRTAYDEVRGKVRSKENIYGKSSEESDLATKIESETERAREFGIYLEILGNAESTQRSAADQGYGIPSTGAQATEATATGGTYVLVRKDGNNFHAEIIDINDTCKNLNELNK